MEVRVLLSGRNPVTAAKSHLGRPSWVSPDPPAVQTPRGTAVRAQGRALCFRSQGCRASTLLPEDF